MLRNISAVLVGALLLAACGDPEQAAERSLLAAQAQWNEARTNLDPARRANDYGKVVDSIESISQKYNETQIGQALQAGRAVAGVSLPDLKREYERLSERASCYAKPTIECLEPFASSSHRQQSAHANSSGNAVQSAVRLACERNFADAEAALEDLRINRPAYSASLVQVALAASECGQSDAVKAAMAAYLAAEPAQGAQRAGALQSVVGQAALRDAWPILMPELERAAASLPEDQQASVDLTLAARHATLGNGDAAIAKFNHVTKELGYTVDINTRLDIAAALMAGGNSAAGLSLIHDQPNRDDLRMGVMHRATQELGGRVGVVRAAGAPSANVPVSGGLEKFFAPVPAEIARREGAASDQIESALDEFVAARQPNGQYLGMGGADAAYARLALVQQKLGNAAKADTLVEKADDARKSMSHPGAFRPDQQNHAAEFQVLVAIGQGDPIRAAQLLPRVTPVGNDIARHVLVALARAGKAEEALTLAAQINRADPNMYQTLINELAAHGHVRQAEQVLNAFTGDASARSAIAWGLVEKAAEAGKIKEAEDLAATHSLLTVPAYKLRMAELRADAAIAGGDRRKAEAEIRNMFSIGEEFDRMAAAERTAAFYAQNAARKAFSAGYTDLGIELYNAASAKDQRPFFDAFSKHTDRADMPRILLTAHESLRGEELGYVIDAAIRGLGNEQ